MPQFSLQAAADSFIFNFLLKIKNGHQTYFNSLELNAYQCAAGVWTIGYGHTKGVQKGMVISEDTANEMLVEELKEYENYIMIW